MGIYSHYFLMSKLISGCLRVRGGLPPDPGAGLRAGTLAEITAIDQL
jgi:hypothetical protein